MEPVNDREVRALDPMDRRPRRARCRRGGRACGVGLVARAPAVPGTDARWAGVGAGGADGGTFGRPRAWAREEERGAEGVQGRHGATWEATRQLVGLSEAAAYADVFTRTLRRYIAQGRLTGYRVGPRLVKVDLSELDQLPRPIPTARGPR